MDLGRVLVAVAVMALVTYIPRMLPLTVFRKKIRNRFIRSFLAYVPYAVLAAMTFPSILYATGSMLSAAAGMAAALVLSYCNKGLLTVAIGSVVVVFLTEQAVHFFA